MSRALDPAIGGAATASPAWLRWLEDASDHLSPILVKEVRQFVKGRDFTYPFVISLALGLTVAFLGAADAAAGNPVAGGWTFTALMTCLSLLGFAVVPLGAFTALRNERLEQTFDLISVTAMRPRQIVVGKLLAQAVKLGTMFAGMAPFVATSFLLGGVDVVSIGVALLLVFACSVWMCAACIFLSAVPKTRAMSGVTFAVLGLVLLFLFMIGRSVVNALFASRFGAYGGVYSTSTFRIGGPSTWWMLAGALSACTVSLINLVLLAENRLTAATDDRSSALRAGFLAQFGLALAWALTFLHRPVPIRGDVVDVLGTYAAVHLGLVGAFTVTEDVPSSRRVQLRLSAMPRWRRWLLILRPGPGWGAAYVVTQMAWLFPVAWALGATASDARWLLALCGYVAVFTGLPTALLRFWRPATSSWVLRVSILIVFAAALILPDVLYYTLWQPPVLTLGYSTRHLVNPVRTLANWPIVVKQGWEGIAAAVAIGGLLSYLAVLKVSTADRSGDHAPQRLFPSAPLADAGEADGSGGH